MSSGSINSTKSATSDDTTPLVEKQQKKQQQQQPSNTATKQGKDDEPKQQQSRLLQVCRMAIMVYAMCLAIAPVTGLQGLFHSMAVRGVYGDKCSASSGHHHDSNSSSTSTNNNTISMTTYPCDASESSIALAGNIIASVMNFSTVGGGLLIDLCGAYNVAWIGFVVWTLSTVAAGIAPGVGYFWFFGYMIQACAGCTAFYGIVLYHAKVTFPSDRAYAVAITVFTALWDGAVLMVPLMGEYFERFSSVPLWVLFAIYAAAGGLVPSIGFKLLFSAPGPEAEEEESDDDEEETKKDDIQTESLRTVDDIDHDNHHNHHHDGTSSRSLDAHALSNPNPKSGTGVVMLQQQHDEEEERKAHPEEAKLRDDERKMEEKERKKKEPKTAKQILQQQAKFAAAIVKKKAFWACTAQITMNVVVGYAFLDNVVPFAKHMGATDHVSGPAIVRMVTIMMGSSSLASAVPGVLLHRLGTQVGCTLLLYVCAVLIALVPVIMFIFGQWMPALPAFYLACGVFFVWRMISCTVVNVCLPTLIVKNDAATGTAFAVAFGVGGIIAIAGGGFVTNQLQGNPSTVVPIGVTIFAMAACSALTLATSLLCSSSSSSEEGNSEKAKLEEASAATGASRFEKFINAGVFDGHDHNDTYCTCMPAGVGFGCIWAGWAKKIGTTPRIDKKLLTETGERKYKPVCGCQVSAAVMRRVPCLDSFVESVDRDAMERKILKHQQHGAIA